MLYKNPQDKRSIFCLCMVSFLVFAGIIAFPYLRADDNYLVLSWHRFAMFDTGMGRPIFWYLVNLNAWTYFAIGIESIRLFRLIGLLFFVGAVLTWYLWLRKWKLDPLFSMVCAMAIFTLPS